MSKEGEEYVKVNLGNLADDPTFYLEPPVYTDTNPAWSLSWF